jgi:hypothetical protein
MSSLDNNTIPIFSQEKIAKSQSFCSSLIPTTPLEPFIGFDDFYHFTYITICNTTHKFYIGKHSTKNLYDGYIGSGNYIQRAISKYGKNSFTRHILQFFNNEEEAFINEAKILTEDVIKTYKDNLGMCYNLQSGGNGGTIYISEETRKKMSIANKEIQNRPEVKAKIREINSIPEVKAKRKTLLNSPEVKAKIRETNKKPEVKAKRKASMKEVANRPEIKAKKKEIQNSPEVKAKIREALSKRSEEEKEETRNKIRKSNLEAQANKPLYLPNSTEIVEIHKDDILSKLKEGYRYAGKTAGIYNPSTNESKNIQFFSKHWKIKDFEGQNINLINHLESGWLFGWYNR